MRLERLKLTDFRGVQEREIEFSSSGVTVVEGRNEVGKTSIADALGMLLNPSLKATSRSQLVRECQPVGRHVGPQVEATLRIGQTRLTYRKRWLVEPLTELAIHAPAPQQLVGDAAHERVVELLEEHAVTSLLESLWYRQGEAVRQPAVAQDPQLLGALDGIAGDEQAARPQTQDALLELVRRERERYWTGTTGRPVAARVARREALEQARAQVQELRERVAGLELLAERHHTDEAALRELQQREQQIEQQISEAQHAVDALAELERGCSDARSRAQGAEYELREAQQRHQARADLRLRAQGAETTLLALAEREQTLAAELETASEQARSAEQRRDQAQEALTAAQRELSGHQAAFELLDLRERHTRLAERMRRVRSAETEIERAAAALARISVTVELMRELEQAQRALDTASARVQAGQPRVELHAQAPLSLTLDGRPAKLAAGETLERNVAAPLRLQLDSLLELVISPPPAGEAQLSALERQQREFDALLAGAGVAELSEAADQLETRRELERTLELSRERLQTALEGEERAALAAAHDHAEEQLQELPAATQQVAAQTTLEQVRGALRAAQSEAEQRRQALELARTALEEVGRSLQEQRQQAAVLSAELSRAGEERERARAALQAARAQLDDRSLDDGLAAAQLELEQAQQQLALALAQLAQADPETARASLENALALRARNAREVAELRERLAADRAVLERDGHSGLEDRLAAAEAEHEERERADAAEERQARAAALLYETLSARRRAAHARYAAPFLEQLSSYARIVYGPEVTLEIDPDSLKITSRTLNGATVAFANLSGGTQEQLAVLARLAVASIVASAGGEGGPTGAPVMIDDALGYSDPARLQRLGTAFSVAARQSQVIVLTCFPERYRAIGDATVVRLG